MRNTHTSGPWCIHRGYLNSPTMKITGDDGESWEFTHTHIGQGEKIIAQVQHQSKDSGWPHVHDVEEMWANARLIAAAPEMLDALREMLSMFGDHEQYDDDSAQVIAQTRQVIAKAEGRDA